MPVGRQSDHSRLTVKVNDEAFSSVWTLLISGYPHLRSKWIFIGEKRLGAVDHRAFHLSMSRA